MPEQRLQRTRDAYAAMPPVDTWPDWTSKDGFRVRLTREERCERCESSGPFSAFTVADVCDSCGWAHMPKWQEHFIADRL